MSSIVIMFLESSKSPSGKRAKGIRPKSITTSNNYDALAFNQNGVRCSDLDAIEASV